MGKDNNSSTEEVSGDADNEESETSYPTSHVSVEMKPQRRILHRVLPQLRENKKHIYEPVVLSLGPYHDHCKSQFQQVEKFKNEVLNNYINNFSGSGKDKDYFIRKIRGRLDEIRMFYEGGVSANDQDLAEMMLRDGFFVLCYMEMATGDIDKGQHFMHRLGLSVAAFLYRDMFMLENQIPFWLIKMLITSTYDNRVEEGKALVCKFLSFMNLGDLHKLRRVPWELEEENGEENEPLHLLEAHRIVLVKEGQTKVPRAISAFRWRSLLSKFGWKKSTQSNSLFEQGNSPFRSVIELKTKGIYFGPSSNCLKDIRFNSYWFYGKLQLPIWYVTNNTLVFFSNIITFEMSPETSASTDGAVLSYVNFMKSLIDKSDDVKELREKGILFSNLRNDEEVMKIFKGIDTYGIDNVDIFQNIKMRINKHCESKAKTWMAELIHTYFRSPWTTIALLYAAFLLCLTFLQTYYTVKPPKKDKGH